MRPHVTALAALAVALLAGTSPLRAAEEGVIEEIRRSDGHTVIIYKDYRPKPKPAKKAEKVDFQVYDVKPAAPVVPATRATAPAPAPAPVAPAPTESYSQTYAPGPNASMAAGGGAGSSPVTTTYVTSPGYGYVGVPVNGLDPFVPLGPIVINKHVFPFQRVDPFAVAGYPYGRPVPYTTPTTITVPTVQTRVVNGQIQVTIP